MNQNVRAHNARARITTSNVGNVRYTDTADRDYGSPNVSIETVQLGTGSRTKLTLMGFGGAGCCIRSLDLNGHEARTLYRVLAKHYGYTNELKDTRHERDEWQRRAYEGLGETMRLNLNLAGEQIMHMRTRDMLNDATAALLELTIVELPKAMDMAYEAGKESMVKPAQDAAKIAYRTGMAKGFKAAQQLELFSELGLPSL